MGAVPATNRQVTWQQASPFQGNVNIVTSDPVNGQIFITNPPVGLTMQTLIPLNFVIQSPPGQRIAFQVTMLPSDVGAGFVDATNRLSAPAPTYPAGQTAWAIATSEALYSKSTNQNGHFTTPTQVSNIVQLVAITQLYATNGIALYTNPVSGQIFISNSVSGGGGGISIFTPTNGFGAIGGSTIYVQTNFDILGTSAAGTNAVIAALQATNAAIQPAFAAATNATLAAIAATNVFDKTALLAGTNAAIGAINDTNTILSARIIAATNGINATLKNAVTNTQATVNLGVTTLTSLKIGGNLVFDGSADLFLINQLNDQAGSPGLSGQFLSVNGSGFPRWSFNAFALTNLPDNQGGYYITTNIPTMSSATNIPGFIASGAEVAIPWPSGFPFDLLNSWQWAFTGATNFTLLVGSNTTNAITAGTNAVIAALQATNSAIQPAFAAATNAVLAAIASTNVTDKAQLVAGTNAVIGALHDTNTIVQAEIAAGTNAAIQAIVATNSAIVGNSQFINAATNQVAASGHTNFLINIAGVQSKADFTSLPWSTGSGGSGGNVFSNTATWFTFANITNFQTTNIQAPGGVFPDLLIGQSTILTPPGVPVSPQNISLNVLNPPLGGTYGNIAMAGYRQTNSSGQYDVTIGTSGIGIGGFSGDFVFNNNAAALPISAQANNQFIVNSDGGFLVNTNNAGAGNSMNVNGNANFSSISLNSTPLLQTSGGSATNTTAYNTVLKSLAAIGGNPAFVETNDTLGFTNWASVNGFVNATFHQVSSTVWNCTTNSWLTVSTNGASCLLRSNLITIATSTTLVGPWTMQAPGTGTPGGSYIGSDWHGIGVYQDAISAGTVTGTNGSFTTLIASNLTAVTFTAPNFIGNGVGLTNVNGTTFGTNQNLISGAFYGLLPANSVNTYQLAKENAYLVSSAYANSNWSMLSSKPVAITANLEATNESQGPSFHAPATTEINGGLYSAYVGKAAGVVPGLDFIQFMYSCDGYNWRNISTYYPSSNMLGSLAPITNDFVPNLAWSTVPYGGTNWLIFEYNTNGQTAANVGYVGRCFALGITLQAATNLTFSAPVVITTNINATGNGDCQILSNNASLYILPLVSSSGPWYSTNFFGPYTNLTSWSISGVSQDVATMILPLTNNSVWVAYPGTANLEYSLNWGTNWTQYILTNTAAGATWLGFNPSFENGITGGGPNLALYPSASIFFLSTPLNQAVANVVQGNDGLFSGTVSAGNVTAQTISAPSVLADNLIVGSVAAGTFSQPFYVRDSLDWGWEVTNSGVGNMVGGYKIIVGPDSQNSTFLGTGYTSDDGTIINGLGAAFEFEDGSSQVNSPLGGVDTGGFYVNAQQIKFAGSAINSVNGYQANGTAGMTVSVTVTNMGGFPRTKFNFVDGLLVSTNDF